MSPRLKDSYSIQVVEHALDLLEALGEESDGDGVQISQLSSRLNMNKSSIFRLLATLELRGYVQRVDSSKRYRLGMNAYEMAQRFLTRMTLLRKARPVMDRLARSCDEAVYLVIRRDDDVLFLDMCDTAQQVKLVSLVGRRFPVAAVSAGKVLLAFASPRDERRRLLMCNPLCGAELAAELEKIRLAGYACDVGGVGDGVACLAAPLFNEREEVEGGVAILGPDFRLPPRRIQGELREVLLDAAESISSSLGFFGRFERGARNGEWLQ